MCKDPSEQAYGTCAYAGWELPNGESESRLIAAKGRVARMRKKSLLQHNPAVMLKYLCNFIKDETRLKFKMEIFIVDSEIVRTMLQKESYGFNTYAVIRIGEIQTSTKPDNWKWLESRWNISDWTTRGKHLDELDEKWTRILTISRITKAKISDSNTKELLKQNKLALNLQVTQKEYKISNCTDINHCSSNNKLIRVTTRILSIFDKSRKPSIKNIYHIYWMQIY